MFKFVNMGETTQITSRDRLAILAVVKAPINFLVLALLVSEAGLGTVAIASSGFDRTLAILGMISTLAVTIAIVIVVAVKWPWALHLKEPPHPPPPPDNAPVVVPVDRVFCAATPKFEDLGVHKDVDAIKAHFPAELIVRRCSDAETVRAELTNNQFPIVHLIGHVDRDNGDFVFDDDDRISAAGLARLMELCEARLVFLATCDSLILGAHLARVTSVIAATRNVDVTEMVRWEKQFYSVLGKGKPLSQAYDVAQDVGDAPMVLLMRTDAIFEAKT